MLCTISILDFCRKTETPVSVHEPIAYTGLFCTIQGVLCYPVYSTFRKIRKCLKMMVYSTEYYKRRTPSIASQFLRANCHVILLISGISILLILKRPHDGRRKTCTKVIRSKSLAMEGSIISIIYMYVYLDGYGKKRSFRYSPL